MVLWGPVLWPHHTHMGWQCRGRHPSCGQEGMGCPQHWDGHHWRCWANIERQLEQRTEPAHTVPAAHGSWAQIPRLFFTKPKPCSNNPGTTLIPQLQHRHVNHSTIAAGEALWPQPSLSATALQLPKPKELNEDKMQACLWGRWAEGCSQPCCPSSFFLSSFVALCILSQQRINHKQQPAPAIHATQLRGQRASSRSPEMTWLQKLKQITAEFSHLK